jgi:hypothetical protein
LNPFITMYQKMLPVPFHKYWNLSVRLRRWRRDYPRFAHTAELQAR